MATKRKSRYRPEPMPKGLHLVLSFIMAIVGAWAWFYLATLFGAPGALITFGAIVVATIILVTLIRRSFS